MFKFNKAAQQQRIDNRASAVTGHDPFVKPPVPEKKVRNIMKKLHKQNGLKRSNSAIEFDVSALTAANRRQIYSSNRSASSDQDNSDNMSEHSEKSPLVSARLDNLARLFFSKSMPAETGSRDTIDSVLTTRPNIKYQYSALDSGNGIVDRSPRERAQRERALNATQEWIQSANGRYEVIAHLDEIGSRHGKNWFLVNDASVRTDRLLTLLPLPSDCVAFEDLPPSECAREILMELLGSLHHPYIYPVLDLGFLRNSSNNYACLVTPFNSRGSLKDLIYKAQWNEPWARKYTRKPNGLPVSQVQRLGRQILEALLFLKERGFPLHGHLHSGNVILQNGAARLSGLENGLLGLSSRINAVMWSRSVTEIENVDIICFGHLLYEMCTGQEMTTPKPSMRILEMELQHYPQIGQILEILGLIFEPPSGVCPSVEDLVLCDLFRSIDLRELRGPCFSTIKPSLSRSTLNLLHAVKKRQCASLGNSFSETSSPCTPPSTPRDHRSGISRTMDSFDISSDSEEGLLNEVVVAGGGRRRFYQPWATIGSGNSGGASCSYTRTQHKQQRYEATTSSSSPIHYCDYAAHSDDNTQQSCSHHQQQQQQPTIRCSTSSQSNLNVLLAENVTIELLDDDHHDAHADDSFPLPVHQQQDDDDDDGNSDNDNDDGDDDDDGEVEEEEEDDDQEEDESSPLAGVSNINGNASGSTTHRLHTLSATAGAAFNHQLTADMCNYKNSKSRRLEYSLKCLKYGRSNPSQDSAFGSLTDNDLSIGSSSIRLSSFQSISSPIDEGVEDVIIATTTAGYETCLELTTMPRSMVSQDSAISSPCRETSPSNFLHIDDAMSGGSSGSSGSLGCSGGIGGGCNIRPQHFPVSLSPKILVTATTNSSNSSLASITSHHNQQQQHQQQLQQQQPPSTVQQFDPPKILVNDQNSIYTTSPSKRSSMIEVFSQKYRVSSFEDMSPGKRSTTGSDKQQHQHLKHVNRLAFRSLEEERRIDNAFLPITDRHHSDNRVNMQSEKYKKLTHASFRISKTGSQDSCAGSGAGAGGATTSSSTTPELQRTAKTLWRDSKFYRKQRIAKSNDSLLESPNHHSAAAAAAVVTTTTTNINSNHRRSPISLRGVDNHSNGDSRQSLDRHCDEFGSQFLGPRRYCSSKSEDLSGPRRYCSSKSEDLSGELTSHGSSASSDYLRVMDARKSYSERHLVGLVKLKQTAINNTASEDDLSFNEDNNKIKKQQHQHQQQQQYHHHHHHQLQQQQQQQQSYRGQQFPLMENRSQLKHLSWSSYSINQTTSSNNTMKMMTNIKTTSLATLPSHNKMMTTTQMMMTTNLSSSNAPSVLPSTANSTNSTTTPIKSTSSPSTTTTMGKETDNSSSSLDESTSSCRTLSGAELSRIFVMEMDDAPGSGRDCSGSGCSEEKTPLLDSVEMSPISPTDPSPSIG